MKETTKTKVMFNGMVWRCFWGRQYMTHALWGKSVSHENNWKERLEDRRNSACKGPEVETKLKNCWWLDLVIGCTRYQAETGRSQVIEDHNFSLEFYSKCGSNTDNIVDDNNKDKIYWAFTLCLRHLRLLTCLFVTNIQWEEYYHSIHFTDTQTEAPRHGIICSRSHG